MTLILDYSFSRPSPASIKAAGYVGVMRYLSTAPGYALNPKDLTRNEAAALHAAGLSIGLVWETYAKRAAAGQSAGAADAHAADAQADALGYPANLPIFYAVDFDTSPATVAPYFTGVRSASRRPVGVYGSARVVEGVHATGVPYVWQACAWSAGKVSGTAHLYQRLRATVAHPISGTDENALLRGFPMWMPAVAPSQAASPLPAIFVKIANLFTRPKRNPAMTRAIQAACHVVVDGDWGPNTMRAGNAVTRRTLTDVRYLQARVGANPDGAWGPRSQAAWVATIKRIQMAMGVTQDGDWGPISKAAWAKQVAINYH